MRSIALTLALLASAALAQPRPIEAVAGVIANHLDAITITCPLEMGKPLACYRYGSSREVHKLMLDAFMMMSVDFRWVVAWTESESILARAFTFADFPRDLYLVGIVEDGVGSVAFVMYSGRVE